MDAVEVHCSGGKVDLAQDQKAAFDEFKVLLDNTECRFAIYDFRFSVAAGERQKLIFIAWWVSLKCILGWLGRVDRWMKCRLMWSYRDHCMSYLLSNVEIPMLCDGKVTFMNHCRSRVNYNWLDAVFVIKSTQGQLLKYKWNPWWRRVIVRRHAQWRCCSRNPPACPAWWLAADWAVFWGALTNCCLFRVAFIYLYCDLCIFACQITRHWRLQAAMGECKRGL